MIDVLAASDSSATVSACATSLTATAPTYGSAASSAQNNDFISAVYGSFPLMIGADGRAHLRSAGAGLPLLVLPAKAVVLNLISVTAAWGVLTLVWQHGFGSNALWGIPATSSIPSWLPVIVFAFLFGLSMDYEVFILARMREEYDATGSTEQAVVRGLSRTGRLVTSAALILFLGFVAMSTAPSTERQDDRHRARRRDPDRRHDRPRAARARRRGAVRTLELVAARTSRTGAARDSVPGTRDRPGGVMSGEAETMIEQHSDHRQRPDPARDRVTAADRPSAACRR